MICSNLTPGWSATEAAQSRTQSGCLKVGVTMEKSMVSQYGFALLATVKAGEPQVPKSSLLHLLRWCRRFTNSGARHLQKSPLQAEWACHFRAVVSVQMKILIAAIACSPAMGSEAYIGWSAVRALAERHEIW